MYYEFVKDTNNQIEKVLKSQSDFIIRILKRPLLPISKKPENGEIIIKEKQEVKYNNSFFVITLLIIFMIMIC